MAMNGASRVWYEPRNTEAAKARPPSSAVLDVPILALSREPNCRPMLRPRRAPGSTSKASGVRPAAAPPSKNSKERGA